jgi:hypothetical protein
MKILRERDDGRRSHKSEKLKKLETATDPNGMAAYGVREEG